MKQTQLILSSENEPHSTITGYTIGNFFVYKGYRYWHIVHLHTCVVLLGDFARRKDALAVVEAADNALWKFDIAPAVDQLENLYKIWIAARSLCKNTDGILRLPKENITDSAQEQGPQ